MHQRNGEAWCLSFSKTALSCDPTMNLPRSNKHEEVIGRTAFWALWIAAMLSSIYGIYGELFGGPMLLQSDIQKFHMSLGGALTERISIMSGVMLAGWSLFLWSVSKNQLTSSMRIWLIMAIGVVVYYQTIPQF